MADNYKRRQQPAAAPYRSTARRRHANDTSTASRRHLSTARLGVNLPLVSLTVPFVTRAQWGARASGPVSRLTPPASFVVIHHTFRPNVCMTQSACVTAMRSMQDAHQFTNGWSDFGYNFAVGGEGSVYEGRGWTTVGAHTFRYNSISIGIVLIGDWVSDTPPAVQMENAQRLIDDGVRLGFIARNYKLIGHRQADATECPGEALFRQIKTWKNFSW